MSYFYSVTTLFPSRRLYGSHAVPASGTALTGVANLLFAIIKPSAPYWAFGFPASILSVFGADFVFAPGSLFVAKVALPHEQSLAGGLLQTMMQVSKKTPNPHT